MVIKNIHPKITSRFYAREMDPLGKPDDKIIFKIYKSSLRT